MRTQLKILLAEDEREIRDLVTLGLKLNGMDVTSVGDGVDAVEAAKNSQFELILLDMNMPTLNGDDTAKQIRELPGYKTIPILFLSGDDEAAQIELPHSDCLAKPFTIRELANRVNVLIPTEDES